MIVVYVSLIYELTQIAKIKGFSQLVQFRQEVVKQRKYVH